MSINTKDYSRRRFITQLASGAVAAPFVTSNLMAASSNGKLNHASFGASGMAFADLSNLSSHPKFNLVAVADVDKSKFARVKKKFPNVRVYQDWRELLDKEGDKIDSVNVSTPDHMHGSQVMAAMAKGKHIYGQKPLAQTVHECRAVTLKARETKVVTQMGIQVSSSFTERYAVAMVQSGAIGKIKEVHSFCNKTWGDMSALPTRTDPVPKELNWDQWLGIAEDRPYIKGYYHPGQWRKRRDFGTGTLGDMGCHMFSGWHRALDLTAPLSVISRGQTATATNWATNEIVDYVYPGTKYTAEDSVKVTWYDGKFTLPKEVVAMCGGKVPGTGSIYVGTEGVIVASHLATPQIYKKAKRERFDFKKLGLKPRNHYKEYVDACLEGKVASANFDYSGPLTESVLLGTLATCFDKKKLEWDAAAMKFKNSSEANALLKRTVRNGWEVAGL